MSPLSINDCVQRNVQLLTSEMEGEQVMLDAEQGRYFGLDAIGSQLWQWLEEPIQVQTLLERVKDHFMVEGKPYQQDVLRFLTELQGQGLLEVKS